ncbi:ATP-binding cassette domain-containing protein [Streptomyces sp. NPDC006733]|uniref:ABC transporter permease subunit n=1 Tax=Streptomyces sp. NPDC006733 TaxID=3155460 RepID=UPI0033E19304
MASLTYDLTLAGLSVGSAAALTGIGLVVTYRATGVFNLAHGAIAMVTAYVLRELVVVHGWPPAPAAALSLLVVAPGIGLALDRLVFRPLAAREAGPAETLVATLGVFVLLVGAAYLAWGGDARGDAPVIVPDDPWAQLAAVVALAAAVGAVTRWTRFGTRLRAVVDDRRLAVLGGIDADRVAAAGWAFGAFTAGLGGVLLAPYLRLDPYGLSLLVMETMAVAVAAGMRSLPVAVGVALVVGVGQSQLTRLHPRGSWQEPLLQAVGANLFVVALLMAALLMPAIGDPSPGAAAARPVAAPAVTAGLRTPPWAWAVCGVLFLLPLGLAGTDLTTSVQVPALGLVLLSLVVVTGLGGQISLGQAAYAGLGALFTALLAAGRFPLVPALPELPALALAVLLVAPLGLLAGAPAVRRRGLALALATFAVGVAVSRFVFAQPYAVSGLDLRRPAGFTADRAYYVLELVLLAAALAAVHLLRRGRTGRALAAVRDHEAGAAAAGVPVPLLKLCTFVAGAGLAALGGGLLGMGVRSFDVAAFDPLRGLLWFAAVLVLGVDSPLGALAAAALLVGLDAGTKEGVAAAVVGVLAVLLGRAPGGLPALLRLRAPAARRTRPVRGRRTKVRRAKRRRTTVRHTKVRRTKPRRTKARDRTARGTAAGGVRLTARRISLSYDGITAVDGVDLAVPPGRVTALTGPNGAGKSTLFDCLCGTARPRRGRVLLDGRDITRLPPYRRARLGLARTFQQLAVFPGLSVAENIAVGAEQGAVRDPEAVERILRLLALGPVRDAPAADLPTGTLRRVELGRALAGAPRVLLLDEPAAGLDSAEIEALRHVLRALAADGMALLLVEHDLELVGALADVVHVMTDGRITAAGPPAAAPAAPAAPQTAWGAP